MKFITAIEEMMKNPGCAYTHDICPKYFMFVQVSGFLYAFKNQKLLVWASFSGSDCEASWFRYPQGDISDRWPEENPDWLHLKENL